MINSLSGRFLALTIVFVMLAEVLILVPSIARFRQDYLLLRLERAQIASLALLATDGMIEPELETELLENAGVYNIVLLRDEMRELVLSSPVPGPAVATFDLRAPSAPRLTLDALARLAEPEPQVIRVIGAPVRAAGLLIEVTMPTGPLRAAMIEYGIRVLVLSAVISVLTALLLFLAVQRLLVVPIRRVVEAMQAYAEAPEDARRIIAPRANVRELREAEAALQSMQTVLTSALRQKERLAGLGAAVAKISHDLRNILSTAQLFADRMETSADPAVARAAPKLVGAIGRAVNLCESTLAFGRAEEPPPRLERVALAPIVADVLEGERLAGQPGEVALEHDVPAGLMLRMDPEQIYRVLANIVRNARQAIAATGTHGSIRVSARDSEGCWIITVADTGPGLPARAQAHLFQPFQGGARKGGTGLGLPIAAELVRGHGGRLELVQTGPEGTTFKIVLPHDGLEEGA